MFVPHFSHDWITKIPKYEDSKRDLKGPCCRCGEALTLLNKDEDCLVGTDCSELRSSREEPPLESRLFLSVPRFWNLPPHSSSLSRLCSGEKRGQWDAAFVSRCAANTVHASPAEITPPLTPHGSASPSAGKGVLWTASKLSDNLAAKCFGAVAVGVSLYSNLTFTGSEVFFQNYLGSVCTMVNKRKGQKYSFHSYLCQK